MVGFGFGLSIQDVDCQAGQLWQKGCPRDLKLHSTSPPLHRKSNSSVIRKTAILLDPKIRTLDHHEP